MTDKTDTTPLIQKDDKQYKNNVDVDNSKNDHSNMYNKLQNSAFASKILPILRKVQTLLMIALPKIIQFQKIFMYYFDKLPKEIIFAIIGLIMCFFGGTFTLCLAASEAFIGPGYDQAKQCIQCIYKDFIEFLEENEKDDIKDEDNDNIPDVLQIKPHELMARKVTLFLSTCKEPENFTNAIGGIYVSFLSVIAVLKVKFVHTISLGNSISKEFKNQADSQLEPLVKKFIPNETHKKWIPVIVNVICKSIAFSIAWTLQRILSSVTAGLRGGLLFSRSLMKQANKKNQFKLNDKDTYIDEIVGYAVASVGIYQQLMNWFGIPFLLWVVLWPVQIVEQWLMQLASS